MPHRACRVEAPQCVSALSCHPLRCAPPANSQSLFRFGLYRPSSERRMECRERRSSRDATAACEDRQGAAPPDRGSAPDRMRPLLVGPGQALVACRHTPTTHLPRSGRRRRGCPRRARLRACPVLSLRLKRRRIHQRAAIHRRPSTESGIGLCISPSTPILSLPKELVECIVFLSFGLRQHGPQRCLRGRLRERLPKDRPITSAGHRVRKGSMR